MLPAKKQILKQLQMMLDEIMNRMSVAVLKIDVEGGELGVLKGAKGLIERGAVRDIVYEDHHGSWPTPMAVWLKQFGYRIYAIRKKLLGPELREGTVNAIGSNSYEPPSYLATLAAERAMERLKPRGWHCLKGKSYLAAS